MITVYTRTYNRERLLPRTIECVLAQTFKNFEYIILNNGSTDGTQAIIDEYSKHDNRIKVVKRERNFLSTRSLNKEWSNVDDVKLPYFLSINDDDFMELNTLETLYQLIVDYDADIATVGSMHVFPDGTRKDKFVFEGIHVYSRIEAMIEMLKREKFNVAVGGKLFRKKIFKDVIIPPVGQIRDIHTAYRRMNNIRRMVVTGKPLYYFYRHDNNISGLEGRLFFTGGYLFWVTY